MLFDLLKLFTEEQDKLTKIAYSVIKALLSLTLMFVLYDWVLGRKIADDVANIDQWIGLIREGNLLVMIFLFFVSQIILFILIDYISFWLIQGLKFLLRRKLVKNNGALAQSISQILLGFDVIYKPNVESRGIAGRNFDEFYDFFFVFIEDIEDGSLPRANQLIKILFAFAFIYVLYDITTLNSFICYTLLIVIFLLLIFEAIINLVTEFLRENQLQIQLVLNWLSIEKLLLKLMWKMGFEGIESTKITKKDSDYLEHTFTKFRYFGKDYIVYIHYSEVPIKRPQVNTAIYICQQIPDSHFIYIVNMEFSQKGKEIWDNFAKTDKTLIKFEDEEDLVEKFLTEFE